MSLYEIKEMLQKKENAVFTLNEFAKVCGIRKDIARVYVHRMLKKKFLNKIEKNKLSFTDDPFIIASQVVFPGYLSLTSALYLHHVMQQVVNTMYVITPRQKKPLKTGSLNIKFIQVQPKLMFGYKKVRKGDSFIMLADLEKTIIDCLLFLRYCRLPLIEEALKKADVKKLEFYSSFLKNEGLIRRLGYLLDHLGKEHGLKRNTSVVYALNPSLKRKGIMNKKWYLYINENVDQR